MTAKLNPYTAAPEIMKPWMAVSDAVNTCLEHSLVELVKLRSSILNGCANCINMHTADARMAGESEQRLYLVAAWRDAPVFTPRERAALAWTDALTSLSQGHTHDAAWDALAEQFTEEERVNLTMLINVINGWNRIATAFGLWIETPATKTLAAA